MTVKMEKVSACFLPGTTKQPKIDTKPIDYENIDAFKDASIIFTFLMCCVPGNTVKILHQMIDEFVSMNKGWIESGKGPTDYVIDLIRRRKEDE